MPRTPHPGHPEEGVTPDVPLLALAAPAGEGGEASEPFEVIRAGKFVRSGREIEISESDLDAMVSNFERWQALGADVPIDYDHSFHEGGPSKAAGWFTELVRKGQSLFARVRWTPTAAQQISDGEYRFFSPEWTKNWVSEAGKAEGPTMLAGGLTNRPFLRGMTPVALTGEAGAEAFEVLAGAVAGQLSGESARPDETPPVSDAAKTPEEIAAEAAAAGNGGAAPGNGDAPAAGEATPPAAGDAPAPEAAPAEAAAAARGGDTVTMSRSEVDELRKKAGQADELKDQVSTMSGRLDSISTDLATERFTADFAQALREGRVDAKDETRETWKGRYEKFGREEARKLLFELPAETIPMTERGRSGENVEGEPAPEGTDQEAHALNARVEAYQAEHPDTTYEAALAIVEKSGTKAGA